MKSLNELGFGSQTYLIEDEDLPFEVESVKQGSTGGKGLLSPSGTKSAL